VEVEVPMPVVPVVFLLDVLLILGLVVGETVGLAVGVTIGDGEALTTGEGVSWGLELPQLTIVLLTITVIANKIQFRIRHL
jgi:hypothetical protein